LKAGASQRKLSSLPSSALGFNLGFDVQVIRRW